MSKWEKKWQNGKMATLEARSILRLGAAQHVYATHGDDDDGDVCDDDDDGDDDDDDGDDDSDGDDDDDDDGYDDDDDDDDDDRSCAVMRVGIGGQL